jgi:DNA-binding GntR family transcriptional regulator
MQTVPSNRDRVYAFIRDEILPDSSQHGSFLTEEQVAERVGGTSRTPVREAFLLLASEGPLQLLPRHVANVPPVTRHDIHEALEYRSFLETKAAEMVIERDVIPAEAMERALKHQSDSSDAGHEKEFVEWDNEFHLALVRAVGNSLMTKSYTDLRARHIRIGIRALMNTPERQAAVIAEHQAIIDGLKSRDPERAKAALLDHIHTTASGLAEI